MSAAGSHVMAPVRHGIENSDYILIARPSEFPSERRPVRNARHLKPR